MREGHPDQQLEYFAIKDGDFKKPEYIPTSENFFVFGPGHQSKVALVLPNLINDYLVTLSDGNKASRPPIEKIVEAAHTSEKALSTLIDFTTQELDQFIPGNDLYIINRYKQNNPDKAHEKLHDLKMQLRFLKFQTEAVNNFLGQVLTDSTAVNTDLLRKLELVLERIDNLSLTLKNVLDVSSVTDELITEVAEVEANYKGKRF